MSIEMWVVLVILTAAVVLFVTEWLRVDLVALLVVVSLMGTGILSTSEALAGFSSSAVLMITFLFIVGGAVWQTGLADQIGRQILAIAGRSELRLLIVLMVAVALLSGFMSNTGTVAVLLPAIIVLAKNVGISPTKLLIPLSFGSMLGGAMTLIGTPPNIIVSDSLQEAGFAPFGFFSFLPMGLLLLVVGTIFMVVIGRHILPNRETQSQRDAFAESPSELIEHYRLPDQLLRLRVRQGSPLIGLDLAGANLRRMYDINVLKIMRPPVARPALMIAEIGHNRHSYGRPRHIPIIPDAHTRIALDDVLIVEGNADQVGQAAAYWNLGVQPPKPKDRKALVSKEVGVAEVVLPPRSRLIGQTIEQSHFGARYHLNVLQINRPRTRQPLDIHQISLQFGDTLLVQGRWEHIMSLKENQHDFVVMGQPETMMGAPHRDKAGIALLILLAMIGLLVWGGVSAVLVAMGAALLMVLSGCLTMDEAYQSIDWKSIVLIAGMLPMSTALSNVGIVTIVADGLVDTLGGWDPRIVMATLFIITAVSTQVLSNTATTVIVAPIAITTAQTMGVQPHAFLMAVAVAASMAFATPVASPTNTLVMGAGGYRFTDYIKTGVPLIGLSLLVTILVLPIFFPL